MLSSIFHFGQISKFKKGVTPGKNWINISCGYAHLHIMSFITTKFHEILSSGFRGVELTRKTGLTDWLTDWRTGQKHYTLRNSLEIVRKLCQPGICFSRYFSDFFWMTIFIIGIWPKFKTTFLSFIGSTYKSFLSKVAIWGKRRKKWKWFF